MKKTTNKRLRNVVGGAVRLLRRKSLPRISQDDLVARLAKAGVTMDRSALARIENGDRYVLDYELEEIARALKVPIARLFER